MNFLAKYKIEIDGSLQDFFKRCSKTSGAEKILLEGMRHAVTLGGKRIRLILGLLAFEISKNSRSKTSRKKVLQNLLSLELIHAFSLVHDDLPALDDDILRRG